MMGINVGEIWKDKREGFEVEVIGINNELYYDIVFKEIETKRAYQFSAKGFLENYEFVSSGRVGDSVVKKEINAQDILKEAIEAMSDRGKTYDTTGESQERSMAKVVAMFNELTGHEITEEQGWDFMILLKLVRASQGYKHDNYVDGSAYFSLAGEAAGAMNEQ